MDDNHQTPPEGLRDLEGLKRAIRAAGRIADRNRARAKIVGAAEALGHADLIPDSWAKDGSLRGDAWTGERRETYSDVFTALNGAVSDAVDDDWYCWVQDFTDTDVIFYASGDLWSVGYTLEPGGAVTLTGDPVKVRPVTSYVERATTSEIEARRRRTEMLEGTREVRKFSAQGMELRTTTDGLLRFSGYASVTETPYEVGGFTETIARGAFKRTLGEGPDVVLLVNHGEGGGLPLARTKSGTMTLTEDARGLRVDADLNPDDPDVQALTPKLERGDVDEMSFAFRVTDQDWSEDRSERLIRSVGLHKGDVSIVTYGANEAAIGALVTLRSTDGSLELRAGKAISSANEEALKRVLDLVASADDAVDRAQPILAEVLGVANPDADDEADGERTADPPEATVIYLPDHTTRAKERLAQLRRAR